MSILVQVLLTFLVLTACLSETVTPKTDNMLKESIIWLDKLQKMEVSCNQMNVANIFADYKRDNRMEILCKATTIVGKGQSCHRYLRAIYDNLLSLVRRSSAGHKEPCPVATGSTTSLKNFLQELHQILQEEYKNAK